MNDIQQVKTGALAPSDYATFEVAKQNDGIIGGNDIAQIRSYAAYARAQAEAIHSVIANARNTEDIGAIKQEALETASTYSRVSLYCDVRIGELLREMPTRQGARTDVTSCVTAQEVTKSEAIANAGMDSRTAYDLQTLAAHQDIVEQVIAEAEERGEMVSRNKALKAIKEAESPNVKRCSVCGVELTETNHYQSQSNLCKECFAGKKRAYMHPNIENDAPTWTVGMLIAELTANAPVWRNTAIHTFSAYEENGVIISQESIDAINSAFDALDAAIAEIVED